ncbi:Cell wall-associated hydrolase, NlpC family [Paenibacillus sp. yr247]|uniref:C40 family peptidase n=1 Tax=Paenibacillus sp. yr247 TaxID=1761880 RepID=UPI00088597EA|nr:C40 family peptidase [Paenibacillus sp. yr247]SDO04536.1 Cell wall-associated hydrolase, NlpC family [Paenibacillus sp. yr247]
MQAMKKNRLIKSLVGISLSLSLLTSGTMILSPQSAHAATDSAATTATYSATSASKDDRIVRTAQSYIGKVRYRFGVRDTNRLILDCSAFTQMVFKKNGITIPWGSSAQAKVGTPVKHKAQLRKGDLVMFSVSKPGRINHVGIYIGNGKFISNTTSSGVVIRDLNTGYWKDRFIIGRHL